MDFAKFLGSINKKSKPAEGAPASQAASPAPAAPPPTPKPSAEIGMEDFNAIQEVLRESADVVRLPSRVVMEKLPPDMRGPEWKSGGTPAGEIVVEREHLMTQLKRGRVVYKLKEIGDDLPQGWIKAADPESLVELSLPDVVEALPDDFFRTSSQVSDEMIEVAGMRDYFGPEAATQAAAEEAAAAPATAAQTAAPKAPAGVPLRKKLPATVKPVAGAWDGVDRAADAGAAAIDLNLATVADLERIKGVGRSRAELIVKFREAHGPFRSVYELAEVRGVGRRLFTMMTGLKVAPTKRQDRHELLNLLLNFQPGVRPTLAQIMEAFPRELNVHGAVLTGHDGVILAQSSGLPDEAAERYAAVAPQFMRRAQRNLKKLTGGVVRAVILPTAPPPLIITTSPAFALVLAMKPEVPIDDVVHRAIALTQELDWLLGVHVVVHAPSE